MAFPLVVIAISSAVSAAVGVELVDVAKVRIRRYLDNHWNEFLEESLQGLGIQIDPNEGVNDANLTAAINQNLLAGSGVQLTSVLDRQKAVKGFENMAVRQIAVELGLGPNVTSVSDVRGALQAWLIETLAAEIANEAGQVLEAAEPIASLQAKIAASPEPKPWNAIYDTSEHGVKNRERQARYRATHTKIWVAR